MEGFLILEFVIASDVQRPGCIVACPIPSWPLLLSLFNYWEFPQFWAKSPPVERLNDYQIASLSWCMPCPPIVAGAYYPWHSPIIFLKGNHNASDDGEAAMSQALIPLNSKKGGGVCGIGGRRGVNTLRVPHGIPHPSSAQHASGEYCSRNGISADVDVILECKSELPQGIDLVKMATQQDVEVDVEMRPH
ncbi:unnamed protein product [Taenia asiatica]|uniref:Uncharacterized protein n=1 Tax=Taenia asiatica TaxID=60517 RepID=A0A0R3W2R3_TAEAS|nr:unnamed protein product [Taenia asiatica]